MVSIRRYNELKRATYDSPRQLLVIVASYLTVQNHNNACLPTTSMLTDHFCEVVSQLLCITMLVVVLVYWAEINGLDFCVRDLL